ncbi:MAG: hypothetical protein ACOH1N_14180 [Lutibacter sp.]
MTLRSDHATIKALVVAFFTVRKEGNFADFHGYSLHRYVTHKIGKYIYPDTIFRIMRKLRQNKTLDYKVLNRQASYYYIESAVPDEFYDPDGQLKLF